MLNKKSMGLHWDVLLIALFVSIGILYYSIASVDIPEVGQYSFNTIKTLEKNSLIPSIIEDIMKGINEKTIRDLGENKIFNLKDYCGSEEYKGKISGGKQKLNGGFEALEGKTSNCIIDEDDLMGYFGAVFEAGYNDFRAKDLSQINLDLSRTTYTSSIYKETDGYFNIINTSNGLEIPISIKKDREDKQIGKFTMKPAYKLPVDYDFNDPAKERCILSKDCGADCDDVIARYSEIEFRKKSYSCNEYFFCADAFPDDFGLGYPCDANFCMETGAYDTDGHDIVCPDCHCTPWATGCGIAGCGAGEMGYTRECRLNGCDQETDCKPDPCCRDPICCENYPPACNCGGNPCCTEDGSLCPPKPEPVPTPTPPAEDSCEGRCGNYNPDASCQCDAACGGYGDCCSDYSQYCN